MSTSERAFIPRTEAAADALFLLRVAGSDLDREPYEEALALIEATHTDLEADVA